MESRMSVDASLLPTHTVPSVSERALLCTQRLLLTPTQGCLSSVLVLVHPLLESFEKQCQSTHNEN